MFDENRRLCAIQGAQQDYWGPDFLTPERWVSYGHQFREIAATLPTNVLEIGPGNGLLAYVLRQGGVAGTTLDLDAAVMPDLVASVTDLPLCDESFDVVACYEVLEHLPWEVVPRALAELRRVCRRYALVSLPDARRAARIHLPYLLRHVMIEPPLGAPKHYQPDPQHCWEIGLRGYPLHRVVARMEEAGFDLETTFRLWEWQYHRFFRLRKRAG